MKSASRRHQVWAIMSFVLVLAIGWTPDMHASQETEPLFSYGGAYNPELYMSTPKGAPLSRGDYQNLPSAVSLSKFAPAAGDQGRAGSCVGWATGYAAASIAQSITAKLSDPSRVLPAPLSPAYVFNQVKLGDSCDSGSYTRRGLDLLRSQGVLDIRRFPYSDQRCAALPSSEQIKQARQYRIQDYIRLSSVASNRSAHIAVRKALSEGQPVVITMIVGMTFQRHRGSSAVTFTAKDYQALASKGVIGLARSADKTWGAHAMTVVGYDDNYAGGSFRIMNSWGKQWGDQGFAWVKYSDFRQWVFEAYAVVPMQPSRPAPPPDPAPDFASRVTMKGVGDRALPMSKATRTGYALDHGLYSGSLLRAEITVSENVHVYIVGTDATSGKHHLLFPKEGVTSSYIPKNSTMLLPGPTEDFYSRLDDNPGTDYFVVLQSREELDTRQLIQKLDQHARQPLAQRFSTALDARMVPFDKVRKQARGQTSTYIGASGILVNAIEFAHLPEHVLTQDKTPPQIVIVEPVLEPTDALVDGNKQVRYVSDEEVVLRGLAQDESAIKSLAVEPAFDLRFSSRGPFMARIDMSDVPIGQTKIIRMTAMDANNNQSTQSLHLKRVQANDEDQKENP